MPLSLKTLSRLIAYQYHQAVQSMGSTAINNNLHFSGYSDQWIFSYALWRTLLGIDEQMVLVVSIKRPGGCAIRHFQFSLSFTV